MNPTTMSPRALTCFNVVVGDDLFRRSPDVDTAGGGTEWAVTTPEVSPGGLLKLPDGHVKTARALWGDIVKGGVVVRQGA